MKFAVLGFGGRGSTYAHFVKYYGSDVVAVCDPDITKKELAMSYGMPEDAFYTDEDEFFAAGKLADALVIATLDDMHYRQAMKALDVGYDILLEKPIAMTLAECEAIRDKAQKVGAKVVVCHVLRYSPYYMKMKEVLDSGVAGEIVCLELTEKIGYYHYAHSYCRGNWRNTDISAPLILAKNCHDTDMICWLIGKKCLSVSSLGSLKYFKEENAPEGSAKYCFECPHKDTCKYSCFAIYNNEEYEKVAGLESTADSAQPRKKLTETL
ncbi:MAG: Gfo/Idh/MocA family oxidoreductase, partial [Clostridia bacterium]|nr:Gfo/Idh/MocA family oxidoreductase [Clostridia bacterium]